MTSKNTLKTTIGVSIVLLFILLVSGCGFYYKKFYTEPQACYKEALEKGPFDAAIIPGYPHQKDQWDDLVKARVYWAKYLYDKGLVKNLIFSGSAVYSPYIESEVMAMYAEKLGVPKENIFTETQAEHSTENLYYSYKIAEKQGFEKVALASDPAQSSFLRAFARKHDFKVHFIPIIFDTLKTISQTNPDIEEEKAFVENFVPITERESFFKRLRGTRGAKVKKLLKEEEKAHNKK